MEEWIGLSLRPAIMAMQAIFDGACMNQPAYFASFTHTTNWRVGRGKKGRIPRLFWTTADEGAE